MTIEKRDQTENLLCSVSLEDLERLVRGIDRSLIINMVKHTKYLQQKVFRGFRPNHLPWDQVPNRLARYAQGNQNKLGSLVDRWRKTNKPLCQRVAEEINIESIEDDVAQLLASAEKGEPFLWGDQVFWALLLDEREEIQVALADGLREKLTNESSALVVKAEQYRLARKLEEAHEEIASLKDELEKQREQNRQTEQIDELQTEIIRQREAVNEVKQRHAETLVKLESARQENANMRIKVNRLEEERNEASNERDEQRNRTEALTSQLEELKHEKEELLDKETELNAQLEQKEEKPRKWHEPFATMEQSVMFPLAQYDEAWDEALNHIARHLATTVPNKKSTEPSVQSNERWTNWQAWQQIEVDMIHSLLELPASASVKDLADTERAQKLLALRWYLLEWLKSALLEMLHESSPTYESIQSE